MANVFSALVETIPSGNIRVVIPRAGKYLSSRT